MRRLKRAKTENLALTLRWLVSPFAIAQLMDRESISQTQRYGKIADARMREAVTAFAKSILERELAGVAF